MMSEKIEKKTALVLSGGGARGAYEAGVWQALTELGVKIDIITGTSVGAINAAMVAQGELELACRKRWRPIWFSMSLKEASLLNMPRKSYSITAPELQDLRLSWKNI